MVGGGVPCRSLWLRQLVYGRELQAVETLRKELAGTEGSSELRKLLPKV